MRATADASPNIALIKYWGKRNPALNLPAVGSISITLSDLSTEMCVESVSGSQQDELIVNGERNDDMLTRVKTNLAQFNIGDRPPVRVTSRANFPIAAGLASSASAFAALTVAANRAFDSGYDTETLARLAGRSSGSAARSLFGGFVELANQGEQIDVRELLAADQWPLIVVIAVTDTGPKPVSSGEAMEISRKTSPFYERWVEQQTADLEEARAAIASRDFAKLGSVAEHNCLKMHSVMWGSRPPVVYWNSATLACLQTVRALQADGIGVFFTIDAGPQVKAVCLPGHQQQVTAALQATDGVRDVLTSGLGDGARVIAG